MEKKLLYGTCSNDFAFCKHETIEFGDGVGNDNVIKCSIYMLKDVVKVEDEASGD